MIPQPADDGWCRTEAVEKTPDLESETVRSATIRIPGRVGKLIDAEQISIDEL
jgi:hypothetical protein